MEIRKVKNHLHFPDLPAPFPGGTGLPVPLTGVVSALPFFANGLTPFTGFAMLINPLNYI